MSRGCFSASGYPSGLTGSEHPHTPLVRLSLQESWARCDDLIDGTQTCTRTIPKGRVRAMKPLRNIVRVDKTRRSSLAYVILSLGEHKTANGIYVFANF